ncbi:hypothetical protein NECID01_2132 [Nematocida sp. AWRm77]|nr:hypothetical protein NECID01_2132 [Nematocida sp. AWRm77]
MGPHSSLSAVKNTEGGKEPYVGEHLGRSALEQENRSFGLDNTFFFSAVDSDKQWSGPPKKDEAVVSYVLSAFTEVCKKIDVIHTVIEKKQMAETEKDALQAEEQESTEEDREGEEGEEGQRREEGWLEKLKKILYGKDKANTYEEYGEEGEYEEGAEYGEEEIEEAQELNTFQKEEIEEDLSALNRVVHEIKKVYWELLGETRRVEAEASFLREKSVQYREKLEEQASMASESKAKLKIKQKELCDARTSLSLAEEKERILQHTAGVLSVQLCQILPLLRKEERKEGDADADLGADKLQEEILRGNMERVIGMFLDIEAYLKGFLTKSEKEREVRIRDLETKNTELSKQLAAKDKELEKAKISAERDKSEKDTLINKQKLAIKYLQSKVSSQKPGSSLHMPGTPSKIHPAESSHPASSSPIITELEQRILTLRERLKEADKRSPLFSKYTSEIEDCKRRLTDFLQI